MKLYYAFPAISQVTQMVVAELGMDEIEQIKIDFASAEQASADYLAKNPLGRVPLLEVEDGKFLSETPAIIAYLARLKPESGLMPSDLWQAAQVESAMSFIASTAHVSFAHGRRGGRWSDDEAVIEALKVKVPANMRDAMRVMKEGHFVGPFVIGDQLTVADFHLFVITHWLSFVGVDVAEFPWLAEHHELMKQRPSTQI